jgi:glycosidase
MQFDFIGMQNIYLSLAREDARPLARALKRRPRTTDTQWASFLRNHDELTLDKLSDSERAEVFAAFGPEEHLQLYGRGLRRRLPTMLGGDPRRIRMAYSLMFSLPGTPVLFYGEEIGMGENLEVEGRLAVRTPMQWSSQRNGGFSTAASSRLPRPVVSDGYGPEHVNVADQRVDPDSQLAFISKLIRTYRQSPELGWADFSPLDQPHRSVLAHVAEWGDESLVAVHNFGPDAVKVPLTLEGCDETHVLRGLLDDDSFPVDRQGRTTVPLDGYGYHWLRVVAADSRRLT